MTTNYKCWNKICDLHKGRGRTSFNELIERHEDKAHYDYCCPKCEMVIICSNKKLKKEYNIVYNAKGKRENYGKKICAKT